MDDPESSGTPWTKVGFGLTAAWMLGVVLVTGNDVTHPLFDYIFSVPLVVWAVGLIAVSLFKAFRDSR